MTLTLITAPATEPITRTEAKAHCRVEHSTDDTLITSLIIAARLAAEHELQRPLITQTWQAAYEDFPSDQSAIALGKFRPIAITSVTYIGQDGIDAVLSPSAYVLDSTTVPGWLHPAYDTSWPTARAFANSVRIRFDSRVPHDASQTESRRRRRRGHLHVNLALLREFDGIPDEIGDDLLQAIGVSDQAFRRRRPNAADQIETLLVGARGHRPHRILDHVVAMRAAAARPAAKTPRAPKPKKRHKR